MGTWKDTHRHREQALPHKAPESNPSQKTKEEEKKTVKERRQRQNQRHIKDGVKLQSTAARERRNQSDRKQYKEKYTADKLDNFSGQSR